MMYSLADQQGRLGPQEPQGAVAINADLDRPPSRGPQGAARAASPTLAAERAVQRAAAVLAVAQQQARQMLADDVAIEIEVEIEIELMLHPRTPLYLTPPVNPSPLIPHPPLIST